MSFIKEYGLYLFGFIAIGGLLVFFVFMNSEDSTSQADIQSQIPQDDGLRENTQPADDSLAPSNVEEIDLKSVGNFEGDGEATRSYDVEAEQFIHNVMANLDDPNEGKFYEGWLVDGEQFISTGKLQSELVGVWSLVFVDEVDLRNYNQVVITEETEADGLDSRPEDHVLEGSF